MRNRPFCLFERVALGDFLVEKVPGGTLYIHKTAKVEVCMVVLSKRNECSVIAEFAHTALLTLNVVYINLKYVEDVKLSEDGV